MVSPSIRRGCSLLVGVLLCVGWVGAQSAGPGDYPATVKALQQRYLDEVNAHAKYGAFGRCAVDEGYPNVAHLFRALAASEAVHARNFRTLLGQLNAPIPVPRQAVEVTTTREHLAYATRVEADEIDREYPKILERIRAEGHEDAITNISWAWQAERQHRDLIVKIRKAVKRWFGFLIRRIEGAPSEYYVCQICGATSTQIPPDRCPICGRAARHYQEVIAPEAGPAKPSDPTDDTW